MAELELGNLLWNVGNANQVYNCPRWVVALLADIEKEISRIYWNKNQTEWSSAFRNTGAEYKGKCFEVHAYSWNDDDDQPCNFQCDDIKISWYKHLFRNPTININPASPGFDTKIICMYEKIMNELGSSEKW
jgi:hypothetical protein